MRACALAALFPLLGMCSAKVFLPEGMRWPARVARGPFKQPEVYAGRRWGHRCEARCTAVDSHCALSDLKVPSRDRGLPLNVCV